MVNLTNAMKNLQESKQNESKKLAKIIGEQNLKKEGKSLKEDYEVSSLNIKSSLFLISPSYINKSWSSIEGTLVTDDFHKYASLSVYIPGKRDYMVLYIKSTNESQDTTWTQYNTSI